MKGGERVKQNGRNFKSLIAPSLGAMGIVFGDIGTSPLYSVRQCFLGQGALLPTETNILGVMSLIFWALVFVISVKYLIFVLDADNNGEGGVMALVALAFPKPAARSKLALAFLTLGLFGTALLFGDGMITPAISVLSAMEGLTLATPAFEPLVIPLTILILVFIFLPQRYGTSKVAKAFGPVILVWFIFIGILGLYNIILQPQVLQSLNPIYALEFFYINKWKAFHLLGTVFLVVTGGEALYADMGHFGKTPIRISWFTVVFPSLVFNYLGQCALILRDTTAIENPFFKLAPEGLLYPTIVIATLATIIASQALISGTFSLTHQAIQLGYFPRVQVIHTNEDEKGQIYVPFINWFLLLSTIFLVLFFESSHNLAAAYGIAITCTMVITTALVSIVAHKKWKWGWFSNVSFCLFFLTLDVGFLIANIEKIPKGGWFPLVIGFIMLVVMLTWKRGREILLLRIKEKIIPLSQLSKEMDQAHIRRVGGTAVFMTSVSQGIPPSLLHNLRHNKVVHETTILMNVSVEDIPHVLDSERFKLKDQENGIYSLYIKYGFMDAINIPSVLKKCKKQGLKLNLDEITYFLGRETLIYGRQPAMRKWRLILFSTLSKNAQRVTDFFKLPTEQVFEIGTHIEM